MSIRKLEALIWRQIKTTKRAIITLLAATFMLSAFTFVFMTRKTTYATENGYSDVIIGDYIEDFGGHKWRVIGKDENGLLVRTDRSVGDRQFSGPGEDYRNERTNYSGSANYPRSAYGTNFWDESDIREWLNNTNEGFAGCFNQEEWDIIAAAPQKQMLWWGDFVQTNSYENYKHISIVDPFTPAENAQGARAYWFGYDDIPYYERIMLYYEESYSYTINDKVFLPDVKQVCESEALKNANDDAYYIVLDKSGEAVDAWTRTPAADDTASGSFVNVVKTNGHISPYAVAIDTKAVTPTLYISQTAAFTYERQSAAADGEQDGYIVYKFSGIAGSEEPEQPDMSLRTPIINIQPQDTIVKKGGGAMLSVSVTAPEEDMLICQWYIAAADGSGTVAIDGATGSAYKPPTAEAGTKYYYCVITNLTDGTTAASRLAAVKVDGGEGGGLSGGAVTGIVMISITVLAFGGFAVYWFVIRKRKKTDK